MADGVTALPEVNQWHMETLKRSFGSEERVITHYAVFLYVFGEQSVESISVRQFLLQYLSVSPILFDLDFFQSDFRYLLRLGRKNDGKSRCS